MKNRLFKILKKLINTMTYILIGLWVLLTIIVIYFLIDKWANPELKSISNRDLKDYGLISIVFITAVGLLFIMKLNINKKTKTQINES